MPVLKLGWPRSSPVRSEDNFWGLFLRPDHSVRSEIFRLNILIIEGLYTIIRNAKQSFSPVRSKDEFWGLRSEFFQSGLKISDRTVFFSVRSGPVQSFQSGPASLVVVMVVVVAFGSVRSGREEFAPHQIRS